MTTVMTATNNLTTPVKMAWAVDSEGNCSLQFLQTVVNQGQTNFLVSVLSLINLFACVSLVLPLHVHKGEEELVEVCTSLKDDGSVSIMFV